jgi:uncharacterized membrane protein
MFCNFNYYIYNFYYDEIIYRMNNQLILGSTIVIVIIILIVLYNATIRKFENLENIEQVGEETHNESEGEAEEILSQTHNESEAEHVSGFSDYAFTWIPPSETRAETREETREETRKIYIAPQNSNTVAWVFGGIAIFAVVAIIIGVIIYFASKKK